MIPIEICLFFPDVYIFDTMTPDDSSTAIVPLESDVVLKHVVFNESPCPTELQVIVQVQVPHLVPNVEGVASEVSHVSVESVVLHDDVRESLVEASLKVSSPVAGCAILEGPS